MRFGLPTKESWRCLLSDKNGSSCDRARSAAAVRAGSARQCCGLATPTGKGGSALRPNASRASLGPTTKGPHSAAPARRSTARADSAAESTGAPRPRASSRGTVVTFGPQRPSTSSDCLGAGGFGPDGSISRLTWLLTPLLGLVFAALRTFAP